MSIGALGPALQGDGSFMLRPVFPGSWERHSGQQMEELVGGWGKGRRLRVGGARPEQ